MRQVVLIAPSGVLPAEACLLPGNSPFCTSTTCAALLLAQRSYPCRTLVPPLLLGSRVSGDLGDTRRLAHAKRLLRHMARLPPWSCARSPLQYARNVHMTKDLAVLKTISEVGFFFFNSILGQLRNDQTIATSIQPLAQVIKSNRASCDFSRRTPLPFAKRHEVSRPPTS